MRRIGHPRIELGGAVTLEVDTDDVGKVTVCMATGELDALSASTFRNAFPRCVGRPKLLVDLTEVRFIDSAGLTVLVGLVRRAREQMGEVAVCARGGLRRVLLDAGLGGVVSVSETTETALAKLRAAGGPTRRSGHRRASVDAVRGKKQGAQPRRS